LTRFSAIDFDQFAPCDQTIANEEFDGVVDPAVKAQHRALGQAEEVADEGAGASDGDRYLDGHLTQGVVVLAVSRQ
jgi:hypothetical protein